MNGARRGALVVGLLLAATPAAAHEVLHEVVRGRAVAVQARYADGEPLAYVAVEVFSPADARVPHLKGRTDRNGWVAFVPDGPGGWRVRIVDETGHGLDTTVQVEGADDPGVATGGPAGLAFALRPALGVVLVAALFGGLVLFLRRKKGTAG